MTTAITITPKYQIHIPKEIRKQAGIKKPGKAEISVENKTIVIKPFKKDFLSMRGKFKVKNPVPAESIRENIIYTDKK